MDPRVAGAGVAMAIGMMVLLPTFNALNHSYVTDVAPPAWLAKLIDPENLPEDFQPPEDMEIPEDMEMPEDMELPPGWEPPPGYDGPIPPGGCPPPVPVWFDSINGTKQFDVQFSSPQRYNFEVPQYTVAVQANVTFTDWQATSVTGRLLPPAPFQGEDEFSETARNPNPGGLLVPPTPVNESHFEFTLVAEDENNLPPTGRYTIEIEIDTPVRGTYQMTALAVLACGGMLE